MLDEAIHTAQTELDSMAERSAPTEQAIFLFQSMMLEDEGMMNEVRFQIKAGVGAAEAMDRVGRRLCRAAGNMKDNATCSCGVWISWTHQPRGQYSGQPSPGSGWRWITR